MEVGFRSAPPSRCAHTGAQDGGGSDHCTTPRVARSSLTPITMLPLLPPPPCAVEGSRVQGLGASQASPRRSWNSYFAEM